MWKQGRRGGSHEGQQDGQELDNRTCFQHIKSEPTSQTCMLHARPSPMYPCASESGCHNNSSKATSYPSGVTDGVTQVRVKSWHQCHYILKRERGIELLQEEFVYRCQELNMGKILVYIMSLKAGLNLQ